MNWRRGLFRIWIVGSVIWISGTFWAIQPLENSAPLWGPATYASVDYGAAKRAGYTTAEIRGYLDRKPLTEFAEWGAVPPIVLGVFGLSTCWIVAGFKARSN